MAEEDENSKGEEVLLARFAPTVTSWNRWLTNAISSIVLHPVICLKIAARSIALSAMRIWIQMQLLRENEPASSQQMHVQQILQLLNQSNLQPKDHHINQVATSFVGETIISPGAKQGLIPLAIPLSKNSSGAVTALLRWPTAPPELEMPVVEVKKHGVWLLAKSVDQFIHRILVEEDAKNSQERYEELFYASADAGEKLYRKGEFAESGLSNLDVYLLRKVGLFPDVLERKVTRHFEEGDQVSALVTGEFYTKKEHFPGFARPYVFNAEVLLRVGRKPEAKDAARGALKSPWWTLGCTYRDVANIAQWDDEQIEYIKEKVTEEGRQEDLKKGKAPAQVVLDEAAFLLDLASIEGEWDDYLERIAQCYEEAGLYDVAKFILYKD